MTYIVNEKCIKCKLMDCVEVCPVDCFYEVMKNPNNVDTENENFRNKIGDILVEVMEEQIKDGKLSIIGK